MVKNPTFLKAFVDLRKILTSEYINKKNSQQIMTKNFLLKSIASSVNLTGYKLHKNKYMPI